MSALEKELFKAAVRTFEELSFMLPESELKAEQRRATVTHAVSVPFDGPLTGRLVVAVAGGVLPAVAANMLESDQAATAVQQQDALGEIANVVCGNLLPRLAGSKAVFRISAPEVIDTETHLAVDKEHAPAAAVQIGFDTGRADVMVFLSGPGPS